MELAIAATAILIGLAVAVYFILREIKKNAAPPVDNGQFLLLQQQLQELTRSVDSKLSESARFLQSQSGEAAKIIRDVTERLTKLDETNRQVVNFADQLQELQDILKSPKQRGIVGEYYLENILNNVLAPDQFQMQFRLKNDLIVDAAVFVKDKIIPIDSKFSLENYNRLIEAREPAERDRLEKVFVNDLKNRIQETAKYIQPEAGTTDFAFMFIPHEAIYYDLIINKVGALQEDSENLIQRAAGKYRVIIVSPTSFLAYLQTILQGLRAMQIEESTKEIRKNVDALGKHLAAYSENMRKLGEHLGRTVSAYETAGKEFAKVDKDIYKITGSESGLETPSLPRPQDWQ